MFPPRPWTGQTGVMSIRIAGRPHARLFAVLAAGLLASAALVACAPQPSGPVLPPVIKKVNELQGATVELPIDQTLVIDTESLAPDSYTATVADGSIVKFVQGSSGGSAEFNPGFEPLKEGETEVTMTNAQGGIQPLTFTIVVVGPSNGTGG